MVKIKGLFIGMDGIIHAENLPIKKREIEFIDGCHPIMPPAVYYDVDKLGPPLYIAWHGRPAPEGGDLDVEQEKAIIKEAVHMSQHKMRPLVSKRWTRLTIRGLMMLFKTIVVGFVVSFAGLILFMVIGL
jgi:hypothetical protein